MTIEEQIKPQVGDIWKDESTNLCVDVLFSGVSRMVIEDNEQKERVYEVKAFMDSHILIERDGKPYKPTPQSLEDRIKAEYPEYEVKMFKRDKANLLTVNGYFHVVTQSMKGFVVYVYKGDYGDLELSTYPIQEERGKGRMAVKMPVAALFTKDSKEEA